MQVKAFYKTSEFWGTHLLSLGALLAALAGALPPKWAAISIAASEAAYSISRGITKQGAHIASAPVAPIATITPPLTSKPQ